MCVGFVGCCAKICGGIVGEDLWMLVFAACAFSEMSVFTN